MANEVELAVQIQRDAVTKQAADATIKLQELERAYRESEPMRLERDRIELERLQSDPHYLDRSLVSPQARREAEVLEARIRQAEQSTLVPRTDAERVDAAVMGDPIAGPSTSYGQQIPAQDFAAAIQADIALGLRPAPVRTFPTPGKSDDPQGHIYAEEWFRMYAASPEMQRLHCEGDPVMRMRHKAATYYLAGRHTPKEGDQ